MTLGSGRAGLNRIQNPEYTRLSLDRARTRDRPRRRLKPVATTTIPTGGFTKLQKKNRRMLLEKKPYDFPSEGKEM